MFELSEQFFDDGWMRIRSVCWGRMEMKKESVR